MATKKKRLANSLRENSDAQASWGNKIRAPKVSDKGNAMVEGGRNKAAHAAGQSTVSTRARYVTAVSKNRKSVENQNDGAKPKSFSGSAMQARTSYRNAIRSKTGRGHYKHPDQIASSANNDTRADVFNRALTGDSYGKRKQDFKNISTKKATGSNMKRRYIREISDFDLQTGDWAREGARAGANLGRRAKWEGKENTTGFYRTTSPNFRKKPTRKGK